MAQENKGRNILDVSMELTNMHLSYYGVDDSDELKQVFTEYYSLAKALGEKNGRNLYEFLPEKIKQELES